jgi:hypothetical protein
VTFNDSNKINIMRENIGVILFFLLAPVYLNAQQNPATNLANRIATKMKDTLNLTANQRTQIYNINMQLYNQKLVVRQQYTNLDSVRVNLQRVENKRDSLYHIILPGNKYQLYRQKKRSLISQN